MRLALCLCRTACTDERRFGRVCRVERGATVMDRSAVTGGGSIRGGLPLVRALLVAALLLLVPSPVAATDLAIVPTLRDPGTPVSGTIGLQPTLRDGGPALPGVPNDAGVGRPAPGPGWMWQDTSEPFTHYPSRFNGTVNAGKLDGAVEYTEPPYRRAWAEGTYLSWTQSDINALIDEARCYRDPATFGSDSVGYAYRLGAAVFHAFNQNSSSDSSAFQHNNWTYSNLPGAYYEYRSLVEVRTYISKPELMSPADQYYAQTYYVDTSYVQGQNPATNLHAEIDYSTYLIFLYPGSVPVPANRDYNAKICIEADVAVRWNPDGTCP